MKIAVSSSSSSNNNIFYVSVGHILQRSSRCPQNISIGITDPSSVNFFFFERSLHIHGMCFRISPVYIIDYILL